MKVKVRVKRPPKACAVLMVAAIAVACFASSCNVTRTVTTKSEYQQRGDTTIVIQTKTTESYDGTKKL